MSDFQTPPEVEPRPLPYCLRHASRADALDSAKCLALFLEEATESLFSCQILFQPEAIYGMTQCFALLRDKLDIASGADTFSFCRALTPRHPLCFSEFVSFTRALLPPQSEDFLFEPFGKPFSMVPAHIGSRLLMS